LSSRLRPLAELRRDYPGWTVSRNTQLDGISSTQPANLDRLTQPGRHFDVNLV
jgi:hypothetical protein